jgi:hypothetical protein
LFDEDGYDDIDGDGNICQMRIRDPFGMYRSDPEDPRLMIRVKPGSRANGPCWDLRELITMATGVSTKTPKDMSIPTATGATGGIRATLNGVQDITRFQVSG